MSKPDAIMLEAREIPSYRKGETEVVIAATKLPQPIAALAIDFINRWGMVAGVDNGEDTAGRARVRLATPQELVNRAIETAELTFKAIQDKGWILDVPAPKRSTRENGGE